MDIKSYEPPLSLWKMITDIISPNEAYEIKSYLGEDLVDQSIELREEITTLTEIYKQVDCEKAAGDNYFSLPEPPEIRERLIKEINFFVNGIRDQARSQGQDPDSILKTRSREIIEYVSDSAFNSRPTTSENSQISTSRSSLSNQSGFNSERVNINLMRDKLNYLSFEEVQSNLKQFLQDEIIQLNQDLNMLNSAFCSHNILSPRTIEPSISQLRTERHELEQILLLSSRPSTSTTARTETSKKNIYSQKNNNQKKSLFKLLPDQQKPNTKLQPLPQSKNKSIPRNNSLQEERFESPLDLGLPESSSEIQQILAIKEEDVPQLDIDEDSENNISYNSLLRSNTNDSLASTESLKSISQTSISSVNIKIKNKTNAKYNSAQKFRQKVLQNRKETMSIDN